MGLSFVALISITHSFFVFPLSRRAFCLIAVERRFSWFTYGIPSIPFGEVNCIY